MKYRKTARPMALLVAALLACQPITAMAVTFADINQAPWPGAETSINKAADLGLVVGETINGKSYFRPRDTVSLSESCQFAYKVLLQTQKASADSSVTEKWKNVLNTYKIQDWAHPAVSFCLEEGIISISDLGTFVKNGSNMPASREQAAEILGRALTVGVPSYSATASNTAFNDNSSISSDARPYIALLNEVGIVNGDENKNFNPKKTLNRTETAVMVTNLYEELKSSASTVTPSVSTSTTSGTVKDLTNFYVNFEGSAAYYLYSSSGATATLNGKTSSVSELVTMFKDGAAMTASLTLDGNNRITKLAVEAEEEESEEKLTEGELTKVVYDDEEYDGSITIEKNSTYRIDDVDDVDIEIDDEEIDFEELYDLYKECKDEGDVIEVELTFDRNDDVSKIIGEVKGGSSKDGDVEGDVDDVSYDEDDEEGEIEVDGDTYTFDEDTDIEIDGDSADWEDLMDAFEDAEDNDEVLEAVLTLDEDDDEYATDIEIFTEDYEDDDKDKDEDEEEYEGEIEDMSHDYDDYEGTIEVDGEEFEAPDTDDIDVDIDDGDDSIDNWEDLYAAFEFGKTIEVTLVAEGDEVISIEGRVTAVKGQLVDFSYESLEIEVEAELDDEDVTEEYEYFFTEHENDEDDDDEYDDWENDLEDIDVDIDGLRNVADMLELYEWLYDDGDEVDLDDEDITITLELDDDGMIVKVTGDRD